jgi:hypothetical protein
MMLPDQDNEFDDLIKSAGDNYHAPGNKADWEQMNALLDKHLPVKKDNRRRLLILFFILFVLLGLTYLYINTLNFKSISDVKRADRPLAPATAPANKNNTDAKEDNDAARQKEPVGVPAPKKQGSSTVQSTGSVPVTATGKAAIQRSPTKKKSSARTEQAGLAESESATKEHNTEPAENQKAEIDDSIRSRDPFAGSVEENLAVTDTLKPAPLAIAPALAAPNDTIPQNKSEKKSAKTKRPLELSLLYAPEITTVGFTHFEKPGSNYGFLLGYQLFKNLKLQTGFIKSRKNYIAAGEDYTFDYPLPPNHKITQVDGYCNMYEIPLNVTSYITRGKKLNWFYTAGISSYFMKSEYYTYYYVTNYGQYQKSVSYEEQKNYWFSLATIGAGLEKQFSPAISFSAMPFIKIPFEGVGEGHLKLTGIGINFLLSYKPAFSSK